MRNSSGYADYGTRLLPNVIDARAREGFERPYASIPISNDPSDGFRDISYAQFANAINRCAQWILDSIGRSETFEVLVYLGPQDLRYQIICIAAIKTGHVESRCRANAQDDLLSTLADVFSLSKK